MLLSGRGNQQVSTIITDLGRQLPPTACHRRVDAEYPVGVKMDDFFGSSSS